MVEINCMRYALHLPMQRMAQVTIIYPNMHVFFYAHVTIGTPRMASLDFFYHTNLLKPYGAHTAEQHILRKSGYAHVINHGTNAPLHLGMTHDAQALQNDANKLKHRSKRLPTVLMTQSQAHHKMLQLDNQPARCLMISRHKTKSTKH